MKIRDLFFLKKSNKNPQSNSVTFFFDETGEASVKVILKDRDNISAQRFALLIHNISSGNSIDSILKTLVSIGEEHIEANLFIQQILNYLVLLENNNDKYKSQTDSPKVKPTDFLMSFKNGI